jgi:uncharacterized protein
MNESTLFLLVRISALTAVLFIQYFVWQRLVPERWRRGRSGFALAVLMVCANLPGLLIVLPSMMFVPYWLIRPTMSIYGLWIAGSTLALLVRIIRPIVPFPALSKNPAALETPPAKAELMPVDEGRRAFLRESFAGIAIVSMGGMTPRPFGDEDFEIVHQSIRLPNLAARHHGMRIAVMSDLHSGPSMQPDELVPYFSALKQLKADMIFLPGDFVQNRNEEIAPVCELAKTLNAKHGIYGVTGNHDYFADAEYISRELQLAGVTMLRNEHRIISAAGDKLAIIGIDDVRKGHPFDYLLAKAVHGLDSSIPNILICHKPYYFEEAAEWGINLMISGHTHGGQIVLARVFNTVITPASLISGYVAGLYSQDSSQLYVTRGIGTVGLPYRLNCPPEITVLTLRG